MISSASKGTLYGIVAIFLWSTIVGLIRNISEYFGPVGGAALIYTTGTVFLILILGVPKLSLFPKRYLFWGALLFVTYEVCLSLALGFATDRTQAIELGMVNYLWPSFTLALAVIVNKQRFSILLIVGLLCSFSGLVWVVSGDNPLTIEGLWKNIQSNPLSYILAFSGAILWAFYSNLTRLISGGNNGIVPFFLLTSLALWGQYLFSTPVEWIINTKSITLLLITGARIGLANAKMDNRYDQRQCDFVSHTFLFYPCYFYCIFLNIIVYRTFFLILAGCNDGNWWLFNLLVSDSSKKDKSDKNNKIERKTRSLTQISQ